MNRVRWMVVFAIFLSCRSVAAQVTPAESDAVPLPAQVRPRPVVKEVVPKFVDGSAVAKSPDDGWSFLDNEQDLPDRLTLPSRHVTRPPGEPSYPVCRHAHRFDPARNVPCPVCRVWPRKTRPWDKPLPVTWPQPRSCFMR